MMGYMISELKRFFTTFGIFIVLFIVVARLLNSKIYIHEESFYEITLYMFDGFNSNMDNDEYTSPHGKLFIIIFVILFNVILVSVLVGMFVNKY